jgi:tripartite-type tricarboxylate transporter receptor subunit TctC
MSTGSFRFGFGACLVVFAVLVGSSFGADYPSKTITVIVPYGAGGSMDTQARGVSPFVAKELGGSIQIENVTGASGVIGFNRGFKSNPDGHTLTANNLPAIVITEISQPNSNFHTREFVPVYAFARDSVLLVTHPDLYKNFDEFVKAAKTTQIRVATTGKGTTVHLSGLIVESVLKVKFNFIPFEGGAESIASLAGKHIDAVLTIASSANAMIRAGRVRPLLILAKEKSPEYPQVPVPQDVGYDIPPFSNHTGILAPPKFPAERLKVLEAAFSRAVKSRGYMDWLEKGTAEYAPLNSAEYRAEIERVYKLVEGYKDLLK